VHFSVTVGDAVLGWVDSSATADGLASAVIHVFAPAAAIPAEVRAYDANGEWSSAFAPVILAGSDGVALWSVAPAAATSSPGVRVSGSAPLSVPAVTALVLDADGHPIGRASGPVGVDDERAGSYGARLLVLGSFRVLIPVARGTISAVRVTWTDTTGGLRASLDAPVRPLGTVSSSRSGSRP
jgi:hypothetical protein